MNLKTRLEKLENVTCDSGDATEHPRAIMLVPFGVTVSDAHFKRLEAEARKRQGKPTGVIFVPYVAEESDDNDYHLEDARTGKDSDLI